MRPCVQECYGSLLHRRSAAGLLLEQMVRCSMCTLLSMLHLSVKSIRWHVQVQPFECRITACCM